MAATSQAQQKIIFWAALFLIGIVSLLSFLSTQRLVTLADETGGNQQVLTELNRLLSSLQDVETGARGYLLTGDERFLGPYRAGPQRFEATLSRLYALAAEDASLNARIGRLEALGRERIRVADTVVARGPPALGLDPQLRNYVETGRATMQRVREEAEGIIGEQQNVFLSREGAVERQAALTSLGLAAGVALSLVVLGWLFIVRGREAARRETAEQELKTLNAELEERVQQGTAEVRRSRELLSAVIENMPDMVFLKDAADEGRYVLVNEAGERLLGRDRAEMLGHVDHELFPSEVADACRAEDEKVTATGRQLEVSGRPISTDQGLRYVDSRKVPVAGDEGEQRFILGIVRDVTEQKALEDQVRQMQRMDAVGKLTGGIAHDFNNLLAVILGNVEILREQAADGSETAELADEVAGAAERGAELVRRMLAFARMQHLEPVAVDLNERLSNMAPLLRRTLGENINIQMREAPGLWKARIDPTQADDALMNLAINARDAMSKGGTLSIETDNVRLDEDYAAHHAEVTPGDYVMLAVSDTGTGMTREVIARAFEPFYTTKEAGRGTGLGLSQVYGWVKQSGGHIKIYSEVGYGTTVKLYLPRSVAAEDADSIALGHAAAASGDETILVVEDNPNVRRTVVRQLRQLGYECIEAESGSEALEVTRSGAAFDLLLTDIVMPGGLTGYELADQLREMRPDQKVLFTSGYTELAVTNGSSPSQGPLLSKPYRKQDLGRAIRSLLDESGGEEPA